MRNEKVQVRLYHASVETILYFRHIQYHGRKVELRRGRTGVKVALLLRLRINEHFQLMKSKNSSSRLLGLRCAYPTYRAASR